MKYLKLFEDWEHENRGNILGDTLGITEMGVPDYVKVAMKKKISCLLNGKPGTGIVFKVKKTLDELGLKHGEIMGGGLSDQKLKKLYADHQELDVFVIDDFDRFLEVCESNPSIVSTLKEMIDKNEKQFIFIDTSNRREDKYYSQYLRPLLDRVLTFNVKN